MRATSKTGAESGLTGEGVRTGSSAAKAFAFACTAASTAVLSSGLLDAGGEGAAVAAMGSIAGGRPVCVVAKTTAAADAATSRRTGTIVTDLAIIAHIFRPIVGPLALTELPCADFFRSSSPADRKFTVRRPAAISSYAARLNAIAPAMDRGRVRTAWPSLPLFTIHFPFSRPTILPTW
jgi:hypothetical protein